MITIEEFEDIVVRILKRDISTNKDQKKAIFSKPNQSLFIVAGPGSGKTTVMVLKILKFIFVDDINPTEILSTTFTRKAADELYSRVLSWGDEIKNELLLKYDNLYQEIAKIDFNQINIGTIDSVAEELLRTHRDPGTNLPVVIESFVANSAMIHSGLFKNDRYLNKDLQEYLGRFRNGNKLSNPSKMSELILELKDRIYFDQIDFKQLYENASSKGEKEALDAIKDYINDLKSRNIIDFPMLESEFLKRLKNNKLDIFLNDIKILLIDEYQDTNLIQENIYFTIAKSAIKNKGSITVVGDDDQSLYRFRGATVDLFTNFKKRANNALGIEIEEINLQTNYRSTPNIINHCNHFVELDNKYQTARVKEKPIIIASNSKGESIPVLGMFRPSTKILAKDLAKLFNNLISKNEVNLKVKRVINSQKRLNDDSLENIDKINENITLKLDDEHGSPSDIAVLTYSPKEVNKGSRTFTYFLRKQLEEKNKIGVFNPRGQVLNEIRDVSIFCGLMLECIDPNGEYQKGIKKIPALAKRNMRKWRAAANEFIETSPEPHTPIPLKEFVESWQVRHPIGHNKWPETASLMELAYKLITWIEELQDDVEGIVYLEAITKTITQTGFFNKYSANIHFDENEKNSIEEALWNIFIPIATGGVEIDENLLETLPEDRINIMSIHQSKGLEFPLVVVDVGSKFETNTKSNQILRFPKYKNDNDSLEDRIRNFSSLNKIERPREDKAFDDLTRLYFVAFSRAEDVLLLIGLSPSIDGYMTKDTHKTIPNIALGWSRDEEFIGFDEIYMI
ncbi:ATP-dependent helicase [Methanobrevibacter sp. OttesenSCG-928-I08]|nr:ATP-dependent helicase [Methanobrevibacter sp. OttesenSCG-928-I08]